MILKKILLLLVSHLSSTGEPPLFLILGPYDLNGVNSLLLDLANRNCILLVAVIGSGMVM